MQSMTVHGFYGGRVLTMDPALGEPEVVLVQGDRILAVGTRDVFDAYPTATLHDIAGRTLMPGFIDAHNHLSIAALHPIWADLSTVTEVETALQRIREQAVAEPETAWIRAAGWEFSGPLMLTRRDLDALGLDRPIIVAHYSLHQCVVCSRGLDQLGIGHSTPDPQGGSIHRDENGAATGVLFERAWGEAHAVSMAATHDPDRWAQLFAARGRRLLRDGITTVHDAACSPEAEAVYRTMAGGGMLPLSVLVMPHAAAILRGPDPARLDGPPTGDGDEWLRVGPAKLFADGGLAPACDVVFEGNRIEFGLLFDGLEANARQLVDRGFGVAVHAMGNAGLQATLDTFAGLRRGGPGADLPLRVEHATLAAPDQVRALQSLGITAVVQPGFVHHMGAIVEATTPDVERWLPFRDLADAGVLLAASSDDPCAFHEPVWTSGCGSTRRTSTGNVLDAEQALGYERWLRAYTIGAAHAGGQADERGSLTPGKRADLVILEGALDAESPPRVAETWVAGSCAFRADDVAVID